MHYFRTFWDRVKFGLGIVVGFVAGFGTPAIAATSFVALLIAIHKGPDTGEIGEAILGQIASVVVSGGVIWVFSRVWEKAEDMPFFGDGFVKGGLAGLFTLFLVALIGGFAGWHEPIFRDL